MTGTNHLSDEEGSPTSSRGSRATEASTGGLTPSRLEQLRDCYRDGLLDDSLKFWTRHAVDTRHGGFFTCLDRDGTVIDTDKGVWQQGRMAWVFGKLYNTVEPRSEWLELCRHGIEFLERHGFDSRDGRLWFQLARDGTPIRKRRYAFGEAFAALAYGELARAGGGDREAEQARRLFLRFVRHDTSAEFQPKFTAARPSRGLGRPMIAINVCQELRESIGWEEADACIERSIGEIRRFHVKPQRECVMETVGPQGEIYDHFDGRLLNPGHAIEGAWFILAEARHRGDDDWLRLGCQMLDWMWRRGWDTEAGGLFSFRDLDDKPVQEYWHDMKFWWPHNEAVLATLLAYELTGEARYAEMHRQVHDWAYAHFPDPEHGDWFGYLHRDGTRSVPLKGNLWKGFFHLPRMQLRAWQIVERLRGDQRGSQAAPPGDNQAPEREPG